jgi:Glutamate synthase domain 2
MNNIENSEENRNRCICPECPSYPYNCEGELLYCAAGKSNAEIHEKGCICFLCPVFDENKLKDLYLCGKESINEANLFMRSKKHNETDSFYQAMVNIKHISAIGSSIVSSMGSRKNLRFTWDDLQFLPAQVYHMPLNAEEKVNNQVIIGPSARKPLTISSPIMISAISFGAVSTKVKNIISEVSSKMGIAFNTGEGGVLKEDFENILNNVIIQYSTGRFGINEDVLKKASAIEIRFGQGAYPGKGSYLPASKMTPEIAEVRNLKPGEAAYSPANHPDMHTPEEIKEKISSLRKISDGVL